MFLGGQKSHDGFAVRARVLDPRADIDAVDVSAPPRWTRSRMSGMGMSLLKVISVMVVGGDEIKDCFDLIRGTAE